MNRLAHWMMRLYPARWRKRYGDEFRALLADTGADARVVADLFKGGVRMQFSTWSFAKLAVVLGIGGLLLGAAGSFLISPIYVSKAAVRIEPLTEILGQVEPETLSRTTLSRIINDPRLQLYGHDLKVMPLEDVIARMRSDIRIDPVASPGDTANHSANLAISFQYPDPAKARQTLAVLIGQFDEASMQLRGALPQAVGKNSLDVVDAASLPARPINGIGWLVVLVGFVIGLSVALAWRKVRKTGLVARRFRVAAVLFSLTGVFAGFAVSAADIVLRDEHDDKPGLLGEQYRSTALLSLQNMTPDQITALENEVLSRASLSATMTDPRLLLYRDRLANTPLEDVIETMRQHLKVGPLAGNPHYVEISFEYRDRFKAQQTVNAVMIRLDEANRRSYGSQPATPAPPLQWKNLTVIDNPSVPDLPVSPNRYQFAGTGGIAGLLTAGVIATIRRRWKPEPDLPLDAVNG